MKRVLVAAALAALMAACSGGSSTRDTAAGSPPIALLGADGNIATFDPASGAVTAITTDAGTGRVYSQPTWSPDGARLAFVASATVVTGPAVEAGASAVRIASTAQETASAVHIAPAAGGQTTVIPTPFAAYYLYWAPDGSRLAFLGSDVALGGQTLGMIDVRTGTVERLDSGQPYYFAWSPESDRLLVHAGSTDLYLLGIDGTREPIGSSPGGFSAPNWTAGRWLFPVIEEDRRVLRLFDADGSPLRDAAAYSTAIALQLDAGGEQIAYIDVEPTGNPLALGPLLVDTPEGTVEIADAAAAFFWSPDGSRLLYLTPDVSEPEFALRWNVWDGSGAVAFERFLPSSTFLQQYLPFFGQYANSHSFMAPDGSAFTFAGTIEGRGSGVWKQSSDAGTPAVLIGAGEISTWAP